MVHNLEAGQRYIAAATDQEPKSISPDMARTALEEAMRILAKSSAGWSPRKLDYAIWANKPL